MKKSKIMLTVLILSMIVLMFSGCGGGNPVIPPNNDQDSLNRASIHGYIKSVEKDLVKNKLIPISNALVYLTDSDGKEHIVSTDKNGFYKFNGLSAGVNYIITASCSQKNASLVYKDVATKVVEGKDLDAGTADATSTTLALLLEELNKNGIPPEEVDADKVVNCEGFSEVKEEVEKVLDEEGDVTETDAIDQSVSSFSSSNLITGGTTWGTEMIELSPDSYQPKISDLIGYKKKDFRFITLDGTKNSVELNAAVLAVEFNLDDGSGGITADLGIFKIILASEGEGERHWIGVEGNILGKAIRIELDFTPGFSAITTSAAYPDYNLIEDTPFVIKLINEKKDESKIICKGNSSQWIFLPNDNNPPIISNLTANPSSVNINQTTTITCTASDPDGDPLTYDWTVNAGSFEGDTSGPSVIWRAPSTADIYIVVGCEVSDGNGGEDTETLNIVVTEPEIEIEKIQNWLDNHAAAWLNYNVDQIADLISFPFIIKNYNCGSTSTYSENEYKNYLTDTFTDLTIDEFSYQNNDITLENNHAEAVVYSDKYIKYSSKGQYFDEVNKIYFHLIKIQARWKADEYRVLNTIPVDDIEKAKINVTFEPNPVPYSSATNSWPFNIILKESNGVGVTLSSLIFEEYNQQGQKIYTGLHDEEGIADWFGTNYIPAFSSIQFLETHGYMIDSGVGFAEYAKVIVQGIDDNGNLIEETDEMDLLPQ